MSTPIDTTIDTPIDAISEKTRPSLVIIVIRIGSILFKYIRRTAGVFI